MFGGRPTARTTEQPPQDQLSYRHRQQAGIDALIAIATPVFPPGRSAQRNPAGKTRNLWSPNVT